MSDRSETYFEVGEVGVGATCDLMKNQTTFRYYVTRHGPGAFGWGDFHCATYDRATAETIAAALNTEIASLLSTIRIAGWSVGVHNDYKLHGAFHTFWLFTRPDGRYVKGEARSDVDALKQVVEQIGE